MNMYVGNLSYNVKEVDLREVMEEYGTVGSVKLIIDRDTRRSKGFAFVEMPETSEASNAIKQLNGVEYAGRPMVVKEALYNPQIQISVVSGTKRSIFRQKNKTKRSKKRLHTTLIKPEQKVNEDLCSGFIVS